MHFKDELWEVERLETLLNNAENFSEQNAKKKFAGKFIDYAKSSVFDLCDVMYVRQSFDLLLYSVGHYLSTFGNRQTSSNAR